MIQGIVDTAHRVSERVHELAWGIRTSGWMSEEALGYVRGDGRVHYTPIPYRALKKLLASVEPKARKGVFIDWGSGLGRVVVAASAHPYREVIGVEYSPELCASARENVDRARARRKTGAVRIVNVDAREFPVPRDSTVMFFYNPFRGGLLTDVVRNIRNSWAANPRRMIFLVANHADFIEDTDSGDWLRKTAAWSAHPDIGCTVFESR